VLPAPSPYFIKELHLVLSYCQLDNSDTWLRDGTSQKLLKLSREIFGKTPLPASAQAVKANGKKNSQITEIAASWNTSINNERITIVSTKSYILCYNVELKKDKKLLHMFKYNSQHTE